MPLPTKDSAPVERQLLRDVVYTRLYNGILDGTLEPGETLLDDKLTAWLGVSRTPIREALMKLADIGLVEMAPNRYTRVAPLDPRTINEAIYTLGLLYEHAARTTVPTLDTTALTRLNQAHKTITKTTTTHDLPTLANALNTFFLELTHNTNNHPLTTITQGLTPQLLRYITTWQHPFNTTDLPTHITTIYTTATTHDGNKTADHIAQLFNPTLTEFLNHRSNDKDIDTH